MEKISIVGKETGNTYTMRVYNDTPYNEMPGPDYEIGVQWKGMNDGAYLISSDWTDEPREDYINCAFDSIACASTLWEARRVATMYAEAEELFDILESGNIEWVEG